VVRIMVFGRNGNCGEADCVAIALDRFAGRFLSGFTAGINHDVAADRTSLFY